MKTLYFSFLFCFIFLLDLPSPLAQTESSFQNLNEMKYAIIVCYNHAGENIAGHETYQFKARDLHVTSITSRITELAISSTGSSHSHAITNLPQNGGDGFAVTATQLKSDSNSYRTNCNDEEKQYKPAQTQLLVCASGTITYYDEPFCDGEQIPIF